jgi:SAC3 family protein LENG8/THP3
MSLMRIGSYTWFTLRTRRVHFPNTDLAKQIASVLSRPQGAAVTHALSVRKCIANGDYPAFFNLYHNAPNLSGYLMDQFVDRERLKTLRKLCKAFRPTLPLNTVATRCGFIPGDANSSMLRKCTRQAKKWIKGLGVVIGEDDSVDCKAAMTILNQAVAEQESKGVDIKGQIH